ncbi:MAG: 2-oxo acid dehydrogenase subunit [Planctomycetota bacterium]|nr:2-oxo acid dehydrogenase subunit [Planctomycetota bacterium]
MAIAITIPRLGWNMDEGVFVGWLKHDGDPIRAGDPLFSLEGEKATQDVESIDAGILKIPPTAPRAGETVAVGAVVGYLLQSAEDVPEPPANPATPEKASPIRENGPAPTPAIRNDHPIPIANSPRISPLARRIAKQLGVDWSRLRGSGSSGRIRKVDILAASQSGTGESPPYRAVPLSPIRRTIASRMIESHLSAAPVTLTTTVDATNLVNLRQQFRATDADGREVPSYTDFVVKLCSFALKEYPALNSRWGETEIRIYEAIHIGIAVDTDSGLLVPVIRDAADLSLRQTAARSRDLIARARAHTLRPSEMRDGTFTVTNLGAFGIEAFTPILNAPECAILGMGRIQRQPVMLGDQVVARERMSLSLTFDHRLVDGAPAARFLQRLGQLIENPGPWFMA